MIPNVVIRLSESRDTLISRAARDRCFTQVWAMGEDLANAISGSVLLAAYPTHRRLIKALWHYRSRDTLTILSLTFAAMQLPYVHLRPRRLS